MTVAQSPSHTNQVDNPAESDLHDGLDQDKDATHPATEHCTNNSDGWEDEIASYSHITDNLSDR